MPLYAERPPLPSDDKRWRIVNGTMRKHGYSRNALIETLHTVQSSFGFLDEPAIRFVAQSLRVPLSQAYGVVTFYHFFSLKPPGKHTCTDLSGDRLLHQGIGQAGGADGETAAHPGGRDDAGRRSVVYDGTLRGGLRARAGGAAGR